MTQPTSGFMLDVSNLIDERIEASIFRAVVTAIQPDSVRIKRTGQVAEDAQNYAACDIYPFPGIGDEVLVLRLGRGYVVVAKIVREGLDVLHEALEALAGAQANIVGALVLGPGGSIRDADGSVWDQHVLRLVSSGVVGDALVFRTGSVDQAYISATFDGVSQAIFGLISGIGAATAPTTLVLKDGQLILGFEALSYTTLYPKVIVDTTGVAMGVGNLSPSWGGSSGAIFIGQAFTNPSSNPTGGYLLYCHASTGALTGRGPSGTVTTIGAADPHCPDCGRDFALEWSNEKYGHLAICLWCATEQWTRGIIDREPA